MSVFEGVGVAMITPFDDNGVNFKEFERMCERNISARVGALCVLGTTGEPSTMSKEEKRELTLRAVKVADKRVPVIIGVGCNSTAETVSNAVEARDLGADALLIVTPYYNKCTQRGLIAHYSAVAEKVDIPIIVYNVPSRTGVNILPETMSELAKIKNIVGIKEASGNVEQLQILCRTLSGKTDIYIGDDSLTYIGMALGAKGVISVAANVVPEMMNRITDNALNGNFAAARKAQFELLPLIKNLFTEVNPIPVKAAMNILGFKAGAPRLPLTEMEPDNKERLIYAMRELKII